MARIIGHRGAVSGAMENSRESFVAASSLGLEWVETDAHLIADGTVVLFHDKCLKRIIGCAGNVRDLYWCDAQKLQMLKLEELLMGRLKNRLGEALGLNVNIELKFDPIALEKKERALAEAVAQLVQRQGLNFKILISSFSKTALRQVKQSMPEIPIGILTRRVTNDVLDFGQEIEAVSIHVRFQNINNKVIEKIIRNQFETYIYTVNDIQAAKSLWDAGVTGIFTDIPEKFLVLKDKNG